MSKVNHTDFQSIEQMSSQFLQKKRITGQQDSSKTEGLSFQEVLRRSQGMHGNSELRFSKHANERLLSRNIDLSAEQIERLESGTKKAGDKGIRESLILVDDLAFIVNVKNQTVITAVSDQDDKIFTNIDGAVIS